MKLAENNRWVINFWSQPSSRWLPQPTQIRKYTNGFNSVNFTDFMLKFRVAVDESHLQYNTYSKHIDTQ